MIADHWHGDHQELFFFPPLLFCVPPPLIACPIHGRQRGEKAGGRNMLKMQGAEGKEAGLEWSGEGTDRTLFSLSAVQQGERGREQNATSSAEI